MKILTLQHLDSIKTRGYLKQDTYEELNSSNHLIKFESNKSELNISSIFQNLSLYEIEPEPYILLICGLKEQDLKQIIRYLCLKWHYVANQLNDEQFDEYQDLNIFDICHFFLNFDDKTKNHRIYFLIEMIYQYFFP